MRGLGKGIGDAAGDGRGDGEGRGVGVGLGRLTLKFGMLKLVLRLIGGKLKFESKPRLVFRFKFGMFVLMLFEFAGSFLCSSAKRPAPHASTKTVPRIVRA